jgi:hypothetical protein
MASKNINEEVNRFNKLLDYDPAVGNQLSEKRQPWQYNINEDEEGEKSEEGSDEGNEDFDFGDEGSPEKGGGDEGGDFDFGGDEGGATEDPESGEDFDFGAEMGGEEDEFGTASEFSAVDDVAAVEDDVEEIDVTAIVNKSDEAKEMAQQAVSVGQENGQFLKSLTDKLTNLEAQLTKMDTIAAKIGKLEQDVKTPEEKLELRSLDSYPFNQKLSDYWEDKAAENDNYRISTGESTANGETTEYTIKPDEIEDFSDVDIKNSFNPNSDGDDIEVYKRQSY